jgi:hypothetical protein
MGNDMAAVLKKLGYANVDVLVHDASVKSQSPAAHHTISSGRRPRIRASTDSNDDVAVDRDTGLSGLSNTCRPFLLPQSNSGCAAEKCCQRNSLR